MGCSGLYLERFGFKILLHDFSGSYYQKSRKTIISSHVHIMSKIFLISLQIQRAHIVGTSYGGIIGLRFALDFPKYVKIIFLLDMMTESDRFIPWIGEEWISSAKKGDFRQLYDSMVPIIYCSFYMEISQVLDQKKKSLLKSSQRIF